MPNYERICVCRTRPFTPKIRKLLGIVLFAKCQAFSCDQPGAHRGRTKMHLFNRLSCRVSCRSPHPFKNALENVLVECAINILHILSIRLCVRDPFLPFVVTRFDSLQMCTGAHPRPDHKKRSKREVNVWQVNGKEAATAASCVCEIPTATE